MPVKINLKEILRNKGITQKELAELTGLRPSTISQLCKNNVDRVYLSTLEIVCKKLDLKIEDLIEID